MSIRFDRKTRKKISPGESRVPFKLLLLLLTQFLHINKQIGTVQGKEQKQGTLHRDIPFINKPLWNGASFKFNVAEPIVNKSESIRNSILTTISKLTSR